MAIVGTFNTQAAGSRAHQRSGPNEKREREENWENHKIYRDMCSFDFSSTLFSLSFADNNNTPLDFSPMQFFFIFSSPPAAGHSSHHSAHTRERENVFLPVHERCPKMEKQSFLRLFSWKFSSPTQTKLDDTCVGALTHIPVELGKFQQLIFSRWKIFKFEYDFVFLNILIFFSCS